MKLSPVVNYKVLITIKYAILVKLEKKKPIP